MSRGAASPLHLSIRSLQKKMRNKTMSKKFWEKATKARVEAMKNGEEDLIDKFHRVVAEVEMKNNFGRLKNLHFDWYYSSANHLISPHIHVLSSVRV